MSDVNEISITVLRREIYLLALSIAVGGGTVELDDAILAIRLPGTVNYGDGMPLGMAITLAKTFRDYNNGDIAECLTFCDEHVVRDMVDFLEFGGDDRLLDALRTIKEPQAKAILDSLTSHSQRIAEDGLEVTSHNWLTPVAIAVTATIVAGGIYLYRSK